LVLSEQGLNAVKILKNNPDFLVLLKELNSEQARLDKLTRNAIETNKILKLSGQAKEVESILSSIASV